MAVMAQAADTDRAVARVADMARVADTRYRTDPQEVLQVDT